MSWQASHWARVQRAGSTAGKAVLLVIAEHADGSGYCFLSHATIADRAEISRRAVVTQMKVLETRGLMGRTRRNDALGHRTSDHLQLKIAAESLGEPAALREAPQGEPRAPRSNPKVHTDARLGAPRSHEKVLEKVESKGEAPRKAETSIPDGFPDLGAVEKERAFLKEQGWNIDAALQADAFRSHALTHDRRLRSWPAAFHQWVIKAIGFAPATAKIAPMPGIKGTLAPVELWRPRMAAFADPTNQHWNTTDWGPKPGQPGCNVPAGLLTELGLNVVSLPRSGAA